MLKQLLCASPCCACYCLVRQFIEFYIREYCMLYVPRDSQSFTVGVRSGILWLCPYQDPYHGWRTVTRCLMTMHSRRVYAMSESGAAAVTELVKILLEDHKQRDKEVEERRRRETEWRQQLELLTGALEGVGVHREPSGEDSARVKDTEVEPKLTKLGESDDVEAYLTTFELMMAAYRVDRFQWVYRLAPCLTRKAQQAYAAMPTEDASTYDEVKAAVLRRYDISRDLPSAFPRGQAEGGETHRELLTCLLDLASKWTKECTTVRVVVEIIVKEQLLDTMPASVRVWVHECKPQDSAEVGQLADDPPPHRPRRCRAQGSLGARGARDLRSREGALDASRWAT